MKKIKALNVTIDDSDRAKYKYIILREYEGEYWYYSMTNDLLNASAIIKEITNGVVVELRDVI